MERIDFIEKLKKQYENDVNVSFLIKEALTKGCLLTKKIIRENSEIINENLEEDGGNKEIREQLLSSLIQSNGCLYIDRCESQGQYISEIIKLILENHPMLKNVTIENTSGILRYRERFLNVLWYLSAWLPRNRVIESVTLRNVVYLKNEVDMTEILTSAFYKKNDYNDSAVKNLILEDVKFDDIDFKVISNALVHKDCYILNLRLNLIFSDSMLEDLAAIVRYNRSVLDFSCFSAENDTTSSILRGLINNNTITSLSFPINNSEANVFSNILLSADQLQTLVLDDHRMGDVGMMCLSKAIKANCSLTGLTIRYSPEGANVITNVGFKYLLDALRYNQTLTYLDVSSNNVLENSDSEDIKNMLCDNRILLSVLLSSQGITSQVVKAFFEGLLINKTLQTLSVCGRSYSPDVDEVEAKELFDTEFENVLKRNYSLTRLTFLAHDELDNLSLKRNETIQKQYLHNLSRISILTAFTRANNQNILKSSVLNVIPGIMRLKE